MAKDYAQDRYPRSRAKQKRGHSGSFAMLFVGILIGLLVAGFLYFRSTRDTETRKFLSQRPDAPQSQVVDQQIKLKGVPDAPQPAKPAAKTNTKAPKFDFYTVLPNNSTKTPEQDDEVNKVELKKPLTLKSQGISQTLAPPKPEPKAKTFSDADVDGEKIEVKKPTSTQAPAKPVAAKPKPAPSPAPVAAKKSESKLPKKYYLHIASFNDSEEADQLKAQLLLLGFDVSVQKTTKQFTNWYRVRLGPYKELFKAQQIQEQLKQSQIKSVLLQSTE